jgi:hypothetical protein
MTSALPVGLKVGERDEEKRREERRGEESMFGGKNLFSLRV